MLSQPCGHPWDCLIYISREACSSAMSRFTLMALLLTEGAQCTKSGKMKMLCFSKAFFQLSQTISTLYWQQFTL